MAEWGWHITPADNEKGCYTHYDFQDDGTWCIEYEDINPFP